MFPKLLQKTSTYVSLAKTLSHGHPKMQEKQENRIFKFRNFYQGEQQRSRGLQWLLNKLANAVSQISVSHFCLLKRMPGMSENEVPNLMTFKKNLNKQVSLRVSTLTA